MAILESKIAQDIKALSKKMVEYEDQEEAIEFHSQELASIIAEAIKSATISGITTAGGPTSQAQVPGTGKLS